MDFFDLPKRTKVGRVIPKNHFDTYTNSKQKKQFTDYILRITWTNKLSSEIINLDFKEIREIEVFKVELKEKIDIPGILEIINKTIPYHIISWIEFNEQAYISTAAKHPHPANEDLSVIDWTFTSNWFNRGRSPYQLNLKGNMDAVYKDFCLQLAGRMNYGGLPWDQIIGYLREADVIKKEISTLEKQIKKCNQFNEKVRLNIQTKDLEKRLNEILKKAN